MPEKKTRIGVYICRCGCGKEGNISGTVEVEKVKEAAAAFEDVEVSEVYEYVCSNPGQKMIRDGIKEKGLNRIVVSACSPRMHLETFRRNVETAGLNQYLLEIANIREQCSWIHDDREQATQKAIHLVKGAVERSRHLKPLEPKTMEVSKNVVVIGGGIAGINSSLELADKGFHVYLVERSPSIGGHMAQLGKTFPTLDCSSCILTPKMVAVSQHPNIEIVSLAEVTEVSGSPGNYEVTIIKHPRFVDTSKCTSCGECAQKCPVKTPSEYDVGLGDRKAIYIPFRQAIPSSYTIDTEHCLYFTKGVCKVCQKFCKADAIDFKEKGETLTLDAGAIVVCTGYELLDPSVVEQYSYGLHPDIVTHLQFERLLVQGVHKPSNGEIPKKVAFVLCVGSRVGLPRKREGDGEQYCCKIGCMNAIKEAYVLHKAVPDCEPWVFYTDIRAHGKGYEEFYERLRNYGVQFMRGRVAEVAPNGNGLLLRAVDTTLGMPVEEAFDMVVLSSELRPSPGTSELARMLGISTGPDGFILERHHKLRPVDTEREGIFVGGCALGPKDIHETTTESIAVASKVSTFLGKGTVSVSPEVAFVDPDKCNDCGKCGEICPAQAATRVPSTFRGRWEIDPMSCVGCGLCLPICPTHAIDLNHSTENQLVAQIRAMGKDEGDSLNIIAFLERETAYASADLAGQTRASYSSAFRIVRVPSAGRIGLNHLMAAFAAGVDGVVFVEGEDSVLKADKLREHVIELKKKLRELGVKPLRIVSTSVTIPQYSKMVDTFEMFEGRLSKIGRLPQETRAKVKARLEKEMQK